MSNENETKATEDQMTAIDKAIAKAKANKAMRASATGDGETVSTEKPAKAAKAPKQTDDEKAAKQAARDAERAAAKVKRDAEREEKRAAKEADRKPAHLSKVERAASKLPELTAPATMVFNEITVNLTGPELAALALHVQHFNRANATQRAATTKIEAGVEVRIVGGDPRYVGKTGIVAKAQRIRCYVDVPNVNKPVYLFTSDVEALETEESAATGTEG